MAISKRVSHKRAELPRLELVPTRALKPNPRNARRHPKRQIEHLKRSIDRFGFTAPIIIDPNSMILAGHARVAAALELGLREVPVLRIEHFSEVEKCAYMIADNRIAEIAEWDREILVAELQSLTELDFDVELTGFSTGEIDLMIDGDTASDVVDPEDDLTDFAVKGPAVSKPGDTWELGVHRLVCGDALSRESYERLLQDDKAQLVVTDPPFNVRIQGHAMGRGKTRHREFAMASGEMSSAEFTQFLTSVTLLLIAFSRAGSIHFLFIDWRHLPELLNAALPHYSEWKNLLVWNKNNAGQGSFYRSKHELIVALKNGVAPHINNFGLGATGRYRTNVLDYPSVNSLHPARRGDLALHPTVKPVALIADLIRDCSRRKGIILDPFCGSGTVLLAAERTGRVARAIELDPLYVDVAVRRWQAITGISAIHKKTGLTFDEYATESGAHPVLTRDRR